MDKAQLCILRHSLGLADDGRGRAYRNHFVTGEGSVDYPHCMALIESGHMTRRGGNELTGGDDLFIVTDAGRQLAQATEPEDSHRLTRSQRRYLAFLDADSGLTFGEWIRLKRPPSLQERTHG